jgi:hypothetical protein
VLAVRVVGVGGDRVDQRTGGEDVVAHRREYLVRRVRQTVDLLRLLPERADPARVVRVDVDDSELVGQRLRLPDAGHRDRGARGDVVVDHLLRVHPVDVVGAEHDDVVRVFVVDEVHALVDRVGGTGEPARAEPLLGRHRGDVVAEQRGHPPGLGDVPVQRMGLVLRQHHDLQITAVGEIRQHEVDHAIDTAEGDTGLGPVRSERHQALAFAACQNDCEHLYRHAEDANVLRAPAPAKRLNCRRE